MLVSFTMLLDEARRRRSAVGAFTVYNLEQADAVLAAGLDRGVGVILLMSSQTFRSPRGPALGSSLLALADRSDTRCCLQLDHESDLRQIELALDLGMGAVMADGSMLPLEENIELVRTADELARRHGAAVEAELGHVGGDEEIASAAARGALTDPQEAEKFAARTGAACLAISIGNVHGRYREPPALDWNRLASIRERVAVHLSLHGASGIPDADVRRAVTSGVAKLNVNTELRDRWFEVLASRAQTLSAGAQLLQLSAELTEATKEIVDSKIALFEGP